MEILRNSAIQYFMQTHNFHFKMRQWYINLKRHSPIELTYTSLSLDTVLVIVTFSALAVLLLPLVANKMITNSTTAPTIQTQGSAYQVVSEVAILVEVFTDEVVESCAIV